MPDVKEGISYEIVREAEETTLQVNAEAWNYVPSIEDNPLCMSIIIEYLAEVGDVTKIVLMQKRDYEYDYTQSRILMEVAKLYNFLMKQKNILNYTSVTIPECTKCSPARYSELKKLIYETFKSDPVGCYIEIERLIRRNKIEMQKELDEKCIPCFQKFIGLLNYIKDMMGRMKIISMTSGYHAGHQLGDREVYRRLFSPMIKPDFMFTKLMATYPPEGEELDNYTIGEDTEVTIFALPNTVQYLYHMIPPEFKLSEEKYDLLDSARKVLAEHKPKKSEFVNPKRMRDVFLNVGKDMLEELAGYKGLKLRTKELEQLGEILVRYTVGFGLVEVLLQDEKIQDITINSPMGRIPIFIVHADYTDCFTNVVPTTSESESWASKLRMMSGRPLDEANPILDTELEIPGAMARVNVVGPPLNPSGLAYSLRRHRDKPWTLPLLMKGRMINALGAGLMSFIIDGSRTMLVAGTRSAGKTSLLGSVLVEIMRKYRMITVEDTLELPTVALRKMGYNIQPMKVASALTKGTTEVTAEEGIRTTLRMGDSCLIVGEVRSDEAKSLYEAMRVGALANVVAGTIHGDSPYGVYDRVVNDIGVPKTSFKATDIIIVANPIKSADGLHRWRRVTQISEVRKHWEDDPLLEKGFVDLMKYESKTDQLEPTLDLVNGESEILKGIAGNVKEWASDWDAVWNNILLRAKIKQAHLNLAMKSGNLELLEAPFVIQSNDQFHRLSDSVREEVGALDNKMIYDRWEEWIKQEIKKDLQKQKDRDVEASY